MTTIILDFFFQKSVTSCLTLFSINLLLAETKRVQFVEEFANDALEAAEPFLHQLKSSKIVTVPVRKIVWECSSTQDNQMLGQETISSWTECR